MHGIEAVLSRFILGSDSPARTHTHAVDLLFSDLLLATIGVDLTRTHVPVEVLRGDRVVKLQVRRLTDSGTIVPSYTEPPEYALVTRSRHRFPRAAGRLTRPQVRILPDSDVAYIRLDECRPGAELDQALRELFTATTMERLSAVVVDLRFNTGGDSRVTARFLRYLGIRNYPSFTRITRYSPAAAEQYGHRRTEGFDIVRNPEVSLDPLQYPSLVFTGQVYVLISRYTAGAATWFATIMKENGFGVLVGEPTGTPPGGYGEPVAITTPQVGLELGVSHSQFVTPVGDDGRLSTGLSPDVLVETRIEDVLTGFDRQTAYVVERARRGR
jgi:C-terminal processing protease CtpA/Prc